MNTEHTYCRLCESRCGLLAQTDGGMLRALLPDPSDPISGGYICETATGSVQRLADAVRITEPMKRVSGTLVPTGWDEAIREIGASLRSIRKASGPKSIGIYLGDEAQRSTRTLSRALAFGVGMGTPHIFSELCLGAGPRLWAAEQMIGHPAPLLSDLTRAHYVLLLSGDQRDLSWGPMTPGMAHERWIEHSRQTKKAKVIVADPRRTDLAEAMDTHLAIRPGTEPFLLLGMLKAIVSGGWVDQQFLDDYSQGFEALQAALEPVDVEQCAVRCGLEPAVLSGIALKFSRAAMAVAHPGASTFANAHGQLGAWAWVTLHAVTANLLRPGGLYESRGAFDMMGAMASVPTGGAPRTRASNHPLLLLQAPATALAEEIHTPGEGRVRALVTVDGDPLGTLPGTERNRTALEELDLLVSIGRIEDATAKLADWVLPATHPWEQAALALHDNSILPFRGTVWTPALSQPAGSARPEHEILAAIYGEVRPGLRGSVWGTHLGMLAQMVARADLEKWEHQVFQWADGIDLEAAKEGERRIYLGETDRSTWRPSTESGRINLLADGIVEQLRALSGTEAPALSLRTSRYKDRIPEPWTGTAADGATAVYLHPEAGFEEGARIQVATAHGSVVGQVAFDDRLREDSVDIHHQPSVPALALLDADARDPVTGVPVLDGLGCTLELA